MYHSLWLHETKQQDHRLLAFPRMSMARPTVAPHLELRPRCLTQTAIGRRGRVWEQDWESGAKSLSGDHSLFFDISFPCRPEHVDPPSFFVRRGGALERPREAPATFVLPWPHRPVCCTFATFLVASRPDSMWTVEVVAILHSEILFCEVFLSVGVRRSPGRNKNRLTQISKARSHASGRTQEAGSVRFLVTTVLSCLEKALEFLKVSHILRVGAENFQECFFPKQCGHTEEFLR